MGVRSLCEVVSRVLVNPRGGRHGPRDLVVGIDSDFGGWKIFDPERRSYEHSGNLYFNEDFSSRIDALRHHDRRRAMMRADLEQPIQLDDFDDPELSMMHYSFICQPFDKLSPFHGPHHVLKLQQ